MRILHIMADGAAGGGPTVVRTLVEGMRGGGAQSAIVTQTGSHFEDQSRADGIETFGVDFSKYTDALKIAARLKAIFAEYRPDVVQAHGARSALPVALLKQSSRPPFVYTVHGFHYTKKGVGARQIAREIERFCIRRTDWTVFVSRADRDRAQTEGFLRGGCDELIYNGVSVPSGLVVADEERPFDIAFIGRLHPQKDPLILPDILLALRPLRPKLLIVASGALDEALKQKIEAAGVADQITFLPAMPRADALAHMARSKIFLLPSLWEGLPMVLGEAMLLDVPVVASAIPGNFEIVDDGATGVLAKPGDAASFADGIRRLMASADERRAIAARAAAQMDARFSISQQAQAHARIFRVLISARAAGAGL